MRVEEEAQARKGDGVEDNWSPTESASQLCREKAREKDAFPVI